MKLFKSFRKLKITIMERFSDRYGYTKPSNIFVKEDLTKPIQDCICSCIDELEYDLRIVSNDDYQNMQIHIWTHYFFRRRNDFFYERNKNILVSCIENLDVTWYEKLNIVEYVIQLLKSAFSEDYRYHDAYVSFVNRLNGYFRDLHFAYRVIDGLIVEVTAEEEIKAIEIALESSKDNIKEHLSSALELYAKKPIGDYRNSIKESISAVEAYCREKTGESSLGKALSFLESKGFVFPKMLKTAFVNSYTYANQPDTGIRHALMDEDGKYVPGQEEALFMLVSCCSFLNYLKKKEVSS